MSRLTNDISWMLGKKPRSVIHYIDPNGKLNELPFENDTVQGAKKFELKVQGRDEPKRWELINPPIRDELGRLVYVCPYNALTNLDIDSYGKLFPGDENGNYWQEQFNTLLNYVEPSLAKEWAAGVEWEKRRQEGKKDKKKGFPMFTLIIIFGIVFVIVIFVILAIAYFGGGVI